MDKQNQQQQQECFTVHPLDESFFFYAYLIRRIWIDEKKRPIVRVTGSHKHSCVFGAVSMERKKKQLFKQYDIFNTDTFLSFLKKYMPTSQNAIFSWIKHYRHITDQTKVRVYFEENKDSLIPIYLPTAASPEFMVMEEVWNIARRDLLILQYYFSFADLKELISGYFRTKRFGLKTRKYLLRNII